MSMANRLSKKFKKFKSKENLRNDILNERDDNRVISLPKVYESSKKDLLDKPIVKIIKDNGEFLLTNDMYQFIKRFTKNEKLEHSKANPKNKVIMNNYGHKTIKVKRFKGLSIGINYEDVPKEEDLLLTGSCNDAKRMMCLISTLLDKDIKIEYRQILSDLPTIDNITPTKKNILDSINHLTEDLQEGDCLFFSFSGHGRKTVRNSYLLPIDYRNRNRKSYLSYPEIYRNLFAKIKKGVKLICVIDCCNSSKNVPLPFFYNFQKKEFQDNSQNMAFMKFYQNNHDEQLEGDITLFSVKGTTYDTEEVKIHKKGNNGFNVEGGFLSLGFFLELFNNYGRLNYHELLDGITNFNDTIIKNTNVSEDFKGYTPLLYSSQRFDENVRFSMNSIIVN